MPITPPAPGDAVPNATPPSTRDEAAALLRLASPAVSTQVATMMMGIVDSLMVARLGTEALAATTLGNVWSFGTLVIAMGIIQGLDPLVSQAHGAGDPTRLGLALQRGLALALLLSVPLTGLWLLTAPMLDLLGQEPELGSMAHGYVTAMVGSIPFFLGFTVLRQYLGGRGILRPAMWVAWIANLVNVFLNYGFIFGHFGLPAWGVVGAGFATGLTRVFVFVVLLAFLLHFRLHRDGWIPWSWRAVRWSGLAEVLRHGVPVGAQIGLEVWTFQLTALAAGLIGATALAAHTIVLTVASFTFMIPLGLGIAAATRVGNLVGAQRPAQARRAALVALGMGGAVMGLAATSFIVLRRQLPLLWSPEPEVLALAIAILPVAAAFQVFDGLQVVGCGILRGVGDTKPAALYNLFGFYALALPIGMTLAFTYDFGLVGLWWGLAVGLASVALLLLRRIHRNL